MHLNRLLRVHDKAREQAYSKPRQPGPNHDPAFWRTLRRFPECHE